MRTKNTDYSVFLLVCIALLVLVVAGGVFFYSFSGTTALEEGNERVISTIFIFENNEKPLCSYVVLYCPETRRASVFDVSGDIGRIIKKINRVDRIDTVYDSKNPDSYISEIENLLDVEITYSAVFDLVSLGKVVDLFDGVTISIPQPIEIFDGNDLVLFPAGRITLDGDKTRNYLSYENEESDIEAPRQRRERFFIGFLNKLSEKNDFIKRRDVAGVFRNLIRTNIKGRVSSGLLDELAKIDTDRTSIQTVGGNYREVSGKQLLIP
ncbi:MAG: LCP family protein, partial [Spirochaetaceae bacterium]|nr:LCP family protein [Spirochaetaceae bacterium]